MTVSVLTIFKNYFFLIFDHFLWAMLLIFKSLFGIVAWKYQILKIWSFLGEQGTVTIFCCFFSIFVNQMVILTTSWLTAFCQICAFFIELVQNQCNICLNKNCRQISNPLKRKYDKRGEKVIFLDIKGKEFETPTNLNFNKVVDVGARVNRNNLKLKVSEPVLTNPYSCKNIYHILGECRELHHIGDKRFWVFLGCDGLLYKIMNKMTESNCKKYDWVTLVPGMGHLHINQLYWNLVKFSILKVLRLISIS